MTVAKKELTGLTGWLDKTFYSDERYQSDIFRDTIDRFIQSGQSVLDAGCGRGALFPYDYKDQVGFMCGSDLTPLIGENQNIHSGLIANLDDAPFADNSFDLIFSRYVLEHLEHPERSFNEIARILKPGGRLICLTPNNYHYVPLISNLTPHSFHERIANLRGNLAQDTFPTFYRANTRQQIGRLCQDAGLQVAEFITQEAKPNYLIMSPVTYAAGIVYERLVNQFQLLSFLRVTIVLVAQKGL